jgi:hypothetical protein
MILSKITKRYSILLSLLLLSSFASLPSYTTPQPKCSSSSECKSLLEQTAKHFLGAHYSYGSHNGKSFDCSGLVLTMVGSLLDHPSLPRTSQEMYSSVKQAVSLNEAKMGDLLFFNTGRGISHVGMYWGKDNKGNHIMFHASSSKGVEMRPLNGDKYWMSRLAGVKRFSPLAGLLNSINSTINKAKPENPPLKNEPKVADSNKQSTNEVENLIAKTTQAESTVRYEDDLYEGSFPESKEEINSRESSYVAPNEEYYEETDYHSTQYTQNYTTSSQVDDESNVYYEEDYYYEISSK